MSSRQANPSIYAPLTLWTLLCVFLLGEPSRAIAQELDGAKEPGTVSAWLQFEEAQLSSTRGGIHRLFTEGGEWRFIYVFVNETDDPIRVSQESLREAFELTVRRAGQEVRTDLTLTEARIGADERVSVTGEAVIPSHQGLVWHFSVRAVEGQTFDMGRYEVTYGIRQTDRAISGVRSEVAEAKLLWLGTHGPTVVIVLPPQSKDELAAYEHIRGDAAVERQDYRAALAAYQRAGAAVPSPRADKMIGYMYLRLGQYREAIGAFERSLTRQPDSRLMPVLATAYVGASDEGNASRVLRAAGLSETQVRESLDEARAEVRRRR